MTSAQFAALRRQLGLSKAELAAIMGMEWANISRLERGERQPTKTHAAFLRYIEQHPPAKTD